ncbi:MAG: protein-ADP-ribose hydrolase [Ruminococcus sp.]|nr:protein-ADP-ribose hydrolase [Ruminococcus sp.]MCM1382376.1 protein-ADP-ribose hydrolase [Muribaculaceae bacterium]
MTHSEKELYLIKYLLAESPQYENIPIPENSEERFGLFRSLVNVRPPKPAAEEFLAVQDEFLREKIAKKGVTDIADLKPTEKNIYLWKGDISALKCGAIVNAANSQMLGCFQPCHGCIDNVIHTFAGVQLRLKCAEIMAEQGFPEPTGTAKITPAYNLPSDYIIHTVGPIADGKLTEKNCRQLENCYNSCLEIAVKNNVNSVAFCCISTGVFGFPQKEAAEIAVRTVRNFIKNHNIEVIFNVFKREDYEIYRGLLG